MKIMSTTLEAVLLGAALLTLSACKSDTLLRTNNPDVIDPGGLASAQGVIALYNGALGDFTAAADGSGGTGVGLVEAGAWFSDEARFGGTPPEVKQMDLRDVRKEANAWQGMYLNVHRAREAAEQAATALAAINKSDARIGEMYAISALSHILLGEHYCSGVPFSTTAPSLDYGMPLTTAQIFDRAIARLDLAKPYAGTDANVSNLTAILRGRALLNNGRYPDAAAAVSAVPTSFAYLTFHGTATALQNNFMYTDMYSSDRLSVSDGEGTNGLNFASAGDPRVPVQAAGLSRFDSKTPMVRFLKYGSLGASVTHASGIEARLIEAEASLKAGNVPQWLGQLNTARQTLTALAPLTDPGTANGRVDLMFRERAFWLYMTGHRVGDLRRLIRQYGRLAESVFPTGPYHKDNLIRGTDVNIIIPISEENNPNFKGCLDRNP